MITETTLHWCRHGSAVATWDIQRVSLGWGWSEVIIVLFNQCSVLLGKCLCQLQTEPVHPACRVVWPSPWTMICPWTALGACAHPTGQAVWVFFSSPWTMICSWTALGACAHPTGQAVRVFFSSPWTTICPWTALGACAHPTGHFTQ